MQNQWYKIPTSRQCGPHEFKPTMLYRIIHCMEGEVHIVTGWGERLGEFTSTEKSQQGTASILPIVELKWQEQVIKVLYF